MDENEIFELTGIVQQIAAGNFSARADISDRLDADDALRQGINMLAEEIERREKRLEEQVIELKRMNEVFVARELKMVEMKGEIDRLRKTVDDLQKRVDDQSSGTA